MTKTEEMTQNRALWEGVSTTFAFLAQTANTTPDEASITELLAAVRAVPDDGGTSGCEAMRQYADECANVPMSQVARELAVDWTLLFRGMNRQTGPKLPYAGAWLSSDGVGIAEMCAVNKHYVMAGFGTSGKVGNRHDYFGIELEFVGRMARRIAEGDERAADALASFLDSSVLLWFGAFVAQAAQKGKTAFWRGYLELVETSLADVRELLAA